MGYNASDFNGDVVANFWQNVLSFVDEFLFHVDFYTCKTLTFRAVIYVSFPTSIPNI